MSAPPIFAYILDDARPDRIHGNVFDHVTEIIGFTDFLDRIPVAKNAPEV